MMNDLATTQDERNQKNDSQDSAHSKIEIYFLLLAGTLTNFQNVRLVPSLLPAIITIRLYFSPHFSKLYMETIISKSINQP